MKIKQAAPASTDLFNLNQPLHLAAADSLIKNVDEGTLLAVAGALIAEVDDLMSDQPNSIPSTIPASPVDHLSNNTAVRTTRRSGAVNAIAQKHFSSPSLRQKKSTRTASRIRDVVLEEPKRPPRNSRQGGTKPKLFDEKQLRAILRGTRVGKETFTKTFFKVMRKQFDPEKHKSYQEQYLNHTRECGTFFKIDIAAIPDNQRLGWSEKSLKLFASTVNKWIDNPRRGSPEKLLKRLKDLFGGEPRRNQDLWYHFRNQAGQFS